MNELLPAIINAVFYLIIGFMSMIVLLGIYIFIKYAASGLFAAIISIITVILFLIGVASAFNATQAVIRIYA